MLATRDGQDLRTRPHLERRARLEELLGSATGALRLIPMSAELTAARDWMTGFVSLCVEIEVDSAYEAGRFRDDVRFLRMRAELHPTDLSSLPSDAWSG
jgi:hypothetical protein